MMSRIGRRFGIRGVFEGFLVEEDGVVYALVPPSAHPTLKALGTPFRLLRLARRYDPDRLGRLDLTVVAG